MDCLDRAIEIDSEYFEAWCNKGEALRRQEKYEEAIEYYDRAIEIHPQYSKAWSSKGLALKALGREAECVAAFAQAEASMIGSKLSSHGS